MSDTERVVAEREAIGIAEEAKDHAELAVRQPQIDLEAAGHLTSFQRPVEESNRPATVGMTRRLNCLQSIDEDSLLDLLNSHCRRLMLPDTNHSPPVSLQGSSMAPVTSTVLGDLRLPVGAIGGRKGAVLWAAMPEADIDEDGDLATGKDEIGSDLSPIAGLDSEIDAIPQPCCMSGAANGALGSSIPSPVRAHDAAPRRRHIAPTTSCG